MTHLCRYTGHLHLQVSFSSQMNIFEVFAGSPQRFNDTYSHICLASCHFCYSTLTVTDQALPLSTERAILSVSELCAAEFTCTPTEQDGTNATSRRGKKMVTFFMLEHVPVCKPGTKWRLWWTRLFTTQFITVLCLFLNTLNGSEWCFDLVRSCDRQKGSMLEK